MEPVMLSVELFGILENILNYHLMLIQYSNDVVILHQTNKRIGHHPSRKL